MRKVFALSLLAAALAPAAANAQVYVRIGPLHPARAMPGARVTTAGTAIATSGSPESILHRHVRAPTGSRAAGTMARVDTTGVMAIGGKSWAAALQV